MLNILLNGYRGRMGQAITALVSKRQDVQIQANRGREHVGTPLPEDCDVIIDVSLPDATPALLEKAVTKGCPVVSGVTGHMENVDTLIQEAATQIPILWASNFSLGVNYLQTILSLLGGSLSQHFNLSIEETHHVGKKDTPSGTAKTLAKTALEAGFHANGIDIKAFREGELIGEHALKLTTSLEQLSLTHTALSREAFAQGALEAACWVIHQPPGLYTMTDMFKLKNLNHDCIY